jgi:hypothetical protein
LWLLLFPSLKLQLWGCFLGISFKWFCGALWDFVTSSIFAKLQKAVIIFVINFCQITNLMHWFL